MQVLVELRDVEADAVGVAVDVLPFQIVLELEHPDAQIEEAALQRAGLGPVEIARRLGVSRMTVWRKLKAMQPCGA